MVEDDITSQTAPGSSLASLLPSWSIPPKGRRCTHEFPSAPGVSMNHHEGSVGHINEHNRCLLRGHWERLCNSTRSDARRFNLMLVSTHLLFLSIASVLYIGLIEFLSEAENPEKKRRSSRQPSSLDSRPLAIVQERIARSLNST